KAITAVAIFTLIERGRLNLSDKVFGPEGVLGNDYAGDRPYQSHVTDITIDHLLTQTSGLVPSGPGDPLFQYFNFTHSELMKLVLTNVPLTNIPGKAYSYSNFAYCVLGRVIEKVSGQSYEAFVINTILKKCGIEDMRIAVNGHQPVPQEVQYYPQPGEDPYYFNISRTDSEGGWLGSSTSLVK